MTRRYSGGRDGVICSWDIGLSLARETDDGNGGITRSAGQHVNDSSECLEPGQSRTEANNATAAATSSKLRQQVQAHTHWINDVALVQNNEALVSASSDMTVKVWRTENTGHSASIFDDTAPAAAQSHPQTIGLHDDYVKCLASPNRSGGNDIGERWDWIASGGLDHKIRVWDLNGAGQKLQIAVGQEEGAVAVKGSVYALAATTSVLASGGPESIVRVWDTRTGKRIRNFVGHTDNIRHILAARDGDVFVTASSDRTVKIWSMTAGRCMHTFTMHSDSVWSLYSDHPHLALFYSSDRSGLVAKTDSRRCVDFDQGICVAVCKENEGVSKIVAAGDYIWTGTSSSSINRWKDVNTIGAEICFPESYRAQRASITSMKSKRQSVSTLPSTPLKLFQPSPVDEPRPHIPINCILNISATTSFHVRHHKDLDTSTIYPSAGRKASEALFEIESNNVAPYRSLPESTIEGQNGLIKHILLNDRRRVLTLDTAGEVMLWDLIQVRRLKHSTKNIVLKTSQCVPIKSFGKRHMSEIMPDVITNESVAHWCSVDTRTGTLTCVLDSDHCFDAEVYLDELNCQGSAEARDDQRGKRSLLAISSSMADLIVNLGKWILRYLFARFIDEEVKRDEIYRERLLMSKSSTLQRPNAPTGIVIPKSLPNGWHDGPADVASPTTPRAGRHYQWSVTTPGLGIGIATPGPSSSNNMFSHNQKPPPTNEDVDNKETFLHSPSPRQSSSESSSDYFTSNGQPQAQNASSNTNAERSSTDGAEENNPRSPAEGADKDSQNKESSALFGKKLRMPFAMKKLSRVTSSDAKNTKPEKTEGSDTKSPQADERVIEDNLFGVVQRIRFGYEDQLPNGANALGSSIILSPPTETPVLNLPNNVIVLIQEERPEHGGVADLFEGTVGSTGLLTNLIEKVAPTWLGNVLLKVRPCISSGWELAFS